MSTAAAPVTLVLDRRGHAVALRETATGRTIPYAVVYMDKAPLGADDLGDSSNSNSMDDRAALRCAWCATPLARHEAKQCADCATVYCLATCQAHHWEFGHRLECRGGAGGGMSRKK
jgi:hypothetical protein